MNSAYVYVYFVRIQRPHCVDGYLFAITADYLRVKVCGKKAEAKTLWVLFSSNDKTYQSLQAILMVI